MIYIAIPALFLLSILGISWGLHEVPGTHQQCILDECPLELHDTDTGGIYVYRPTSRIGFVFDNSINPKADFSIDCSPDGTLGQVSNQPSVKAPKYAERFEATVTGKCTVRDDNFVATIEIKDPNN